MIRAISVLLVLIMATASIFTCRTSEPVSYSFLFEHDMEGWIARGLDLDSPTVDWSIEHSQEIASSGSSSVKLYLNNMNDKGKIWMQREFDLNPNRSYRVDVEYMFASSDFGSFNLWKIITGVIPDAPVTVDDLVYQGNSANGSDSDVGYVWLQKDHNFVAETDETGKLYVIIGIWGTWESPRTYYIDDVDITFR